MSFVIASLLFCIFICFSLLSPEKSSRDILVKVGPYGNCGTNFNYDFDDDVYENLLEDLGFPRWCDPWSWDDSGKGAVKQIYIRHGKAINSIQTLNEFNGNVVLLDKHGGDGPNFNMITIPPSNSIISVSGSSDILGGHQMITSIKIRTNDGAVYGPYGTENPNSSAFKFDVEASKFAGFHGYSNSEYLTAIGIYVNPIASSTGVGAQVRSLSRLTLQPKEESTT